MIWCLVPYTQIRYFKQASRTNAVVSRCKSDIIWGDMNHQESGLAGIRIIILYNIAHRFNLNKSLIGIILQNITNIIYSYRYVIRSVNITLKYFGFSPIFSIILKFTNNLKFQTRVDKKSTRDDSISSKKSCRPDRKFNHSYRIINNILKNTHKEQWTVNKTQTPQWQHQAK